MKIKRMVFSLWVIMLIACHPSGQHRYQGYVEGENIYLASPNAGILQKLFVRRGESVHKGRLLFKLDEQPQQLIVKQREADLRQAKQTLIDLKKPRRTPEIEAIEARIAQAEAKRQLAELRVKRRKALYARHAIDKESVDEAIAAYEEQKQLKEQYEQDLALAKLGSREKQIEAQAARVQALNEQLQEAKWQLEQKTIKAPAAGIIYDTFYEEGEYVANQQPVLALLTPENVRIEFFVPVTELSHLHAGQNIQFICYSCNQESSAEINYISPEAEYVPPLVYSRENDDKIVFRVKARILQPESYKPGQPVTVLLR